MTDRLVGKVVLITGTGGGQGRAAAELFCTEGASVVGCDMNTVESERTVQRVRDAGGDMVGMAPVDLGDSTAARQWVADAGDFHGRVDVLYNNAAAPRFAAIADMTDDDWHFTIRNELDLIFFVTQAAWPHLMAASGVIVDIASVQGLIGIANGGVAHAATKAGVIAMTRQMAIEGAPHGIRANCISPGTIATPATAELFADDEMRRRIIDPLLIKRLCQPVDVASLALFLASEGSAYITGANLVVDGGLTAI